MIAVSTFSSRVLRRRGVDGVIVSGITMIVAVILILGGVALSGDDLRAVYLIPGFAALGTLTAFSIPSGVLLTLGNVPVAKASDGSGLYQTLQQYLGATGIALFTSIYFGVVGARTDADAYLSALRWSLVPLLLTGVVLIPLARWLEHAGYFAAIPPPVPILQPDLS